MEYKVRASTLCEARKRYADFFSLVIESYAGSSEYAEGARGGV